MKNPSRSYWKKREEQARKERARREEGYQAKIEEIYEDMLDDVQQEIDSFYAKYAKKEGISIAEAKKRASKLDIEEYARKAKKYVKSKDFSKEANEDMRLYNMTMKVNRLELLKAKIALELTGNFDKLHEYYNEVITDETMKEFERLAGILGETITNADTVKRVKAITGASFHNATFSERIWGQRDLLKLELEKHLRTALIQGKSSRELAGKLVKVFGVSRYNAERLMTTELRRVQTEVARQSYEKNGNEMYEYMATGPHPCKICKGLDGKVFNVTDMMPGENAPPMHPQCHCTTAPHWDKEEYEQWLDYLDKGGTTEERKKIKNKEKEESKRKYQYENTVILKQYIDSPAYRRKFDSISEDGKVNRMAWQMSKEMLNHRSGSKYEDLAFIDYTTRKGLLNKGYDAESRAMPSKNMIKMLNKAEKGTIVAIHNHPGSSVPSLADLMVCMKREYKFGMVVCHDGKIYKYSVDKSRFNPAILNAALDKLEVQGYNENIEKMFKDSGVTMEVL